MRLQDLLERCLGTASVVIHIPSQHSTIFQGDANLALQKIDYDVRKRNVIYIQALPELEPTIGIFIEEK